MFLPQNILESKISKKILCTSLSLYIWSTPQEGGGGILKTKVLKGKYKAKLEFPEGWGGGGG